MDNPVTNFRSPSPRDRGGLAAFSIYLVFSLLVLGRSLWGRFVSFRLGSAGPDPSYFMWMLAWWRYALSRRLNPFVSGYVWAPEGINLAWTTSIPLPAIVMWPITAVFGPIASFNVLELVAPALAAWSGFLLCRRLSDSRWAALVGGYIFGFSPYLMLEEYMGHPCLTLVFLVPLAVLAVARAITGELSAFGLIWRLAPILAAQFLISTEIFATMTMFGAIALLLGCLFAPPDSARRLAKAAFQILCAYLIAAAVLGPYLYWLFAFGWPHGKFWTLMQERFNSGTLNILPQVNLQLLAMVAAYAWSRWRTPMGRVLLCLSVAVSLLTSAPRIHFHGLTLMTPAAIPMALPFIDKAMTYRYAMYNFLLVAIMASIWLGSNRLGPKANFAVAAIVVMGSMPDLSAQWAHPASVPAFFIDGSYRDYLRPGDKVIVTPFGYRGESMLWQAETGMYFKMVGGWTGPHPAAFNNWPMFKAFTDATYLPDAAEQLGAFMANHQTEKAVVANSDPNAAYWNSLFAPFASARYRVGGVTIYPISASALRPFQGVSALEMRRRAASVGIGRLLIAAGEWLSAGHDPAQLNAYRALQAGMLKAEWCAGPSTGWFPNENNKAVAPGSIWFCGVRIGRLPGGRVAVGMPGSYAALEPIIARYRHAAAHIYFPYPNDLLAPGAAAPSPDTAAFMVLVFDPDRIAAIAAQLRASPPP